MQNLPGVAPHIVDNKPPTAPAKAPTSTKIRLKGLDDLDKRTNAARAAYALRDAIVDDLGGIDELSALKVELVNTVAVQTALLNDAHARLLSGDPGAPSLTELATLTNTRNRTATAVGFSKAVKTLDLKSYLAEKREALQ